MNTIVAIAAYGGLNEEDSLIFNKSASERNLFAGSNYNFIKTVLEKGEKFQTPDEMTTTGIKNYANYEHLDNGYIRPGTIVKYNDVLVGKVVELPLKKNGKTHKDASVVYPLEEKAIVDKVIRARNQDDVKFCTVKLSSNRQFTMGDKFSSRAGQKGIMGEGKYPADMLFTESGIIPDFILNPHSIPSRMTIGQLIEGLVAKICAIKGISMDASMFTKIDLNTLGDTLEKLGFDRYGNERLYNGMNGEWLDVEIFITPCYYQRLQKFVVDEVYSISTGPTNVLTFQPLEGKARRGGLRIGEMGHDVLAATGCTQFLMEKFREDSDGYEIYVCTNCGKRPIVNEYIKKVICKNCPYSDIVKVRSSWTTKLILQQLESSNVGVKLGTTPYEY